MQANMHKQFVLVSAWRLTAVFIIAIRFLFVNRLGKNLPWITRKVGSIRFHLGLILPTLFILDYFFDLTNKKCYRVTVEGNLTAPKLKEQLSGEARKEYNQAKPSRRTCRLVWLGEPDSSVVKKWQQNLMGNLYNYQI